MDSIEFHSKFIPELQERISKLHSDVKLVGKDHDLYHVQLGEMAYPAMVYISLNLVNKLKDYSGIEVADEIVRYCTDSIRLNKQTYRYYLIDKNRD